ncbi:tRNA 4-thiouridine(8) synthase ThiI [Spirochaetota bacterium]
MDVLYLIKLGEIQLKEGNRKEFTKLLKLNLKRKLSGCKTEITGREGRFYLRLDSAHAKEAEFALARTPGINGWARAESCDKKLPLIEELVLNEAMSALGKGASSFKVEVRRSDKSFPLDSYGLASQLGAVVLDKLPGLTVNVKKPDASIHVEIRDKAYVYGQAEKGVRGLPVASGGKGLLLLSGGIDSPVAGYRMLCRGLDLEAMYFHSHPYTSKEALEKVKSLAGILAGYSGEMTLHTCHFTEVQLKINKDATPDRTTLYLRAAMIRAAELLAKSRGLKAIVSGESLGQVASQTVENMRFTASYSDLPVLRPLVGTDKEDIVKCSREIGSFETSILPYEDCCVLFAPKHPVLRAVYETERAGFDRLELDCLIKEAVKGIETETLHGVRV